MTEAACLETYIRRQSNPADHLSTTDTTSALILGLLKKIEQARNAIDNHKPIQAGLYIGRATAIIDALRDDLDFQAGGQIARDYDRLYGLIDECLQKSTRNNAEAFLATAAEYVFKISNWWTFDGHAHCGQIGHA